MKPLISVLAVILTVVLSTDARAEEELFTKASAQMRAGQLKEASQTVRKFLRRNPRSAKGWALSANINLRLKETMLAIVEFSKAIERDPSPDVSLYIARARAWTRLPIEKDKNLKHAIASLDEGLKRLGARHELLSYRGELEARLQKMGGSVERAPNSKPSAEDRSSQFTIKSVRSTKL